MQISLQHERQRLEQAAHPSERDLAGFMRGTASREEAMIVVRHLLTRCRTCLDVTMKLWCLGDRVPPEKAALRRRTACDRYENELREEAQRKP